MFNFRLLQFVMVLASLLLFSGPVLSQATTTEDAPQTTETQATEETGDESDLARRIEAGGEITLEAGEYEFDSLSIRSNTKLIGAGSEETLIRFSGSGLSVKDTEIEISGISFIHDGSVGANVAMFENSLVTLSDCAFSGARIVNAETDQDVGAGAFFLRVEGEITDCVFADNQTGIVVGRGSILPFEGIEITNNLEDGLLAVANAYVVLEWSLVSGNGIHGVTAFNDSYLRLSRNTVEKNGGSGMFLGDNASAVAIGTLFNQNVEVGLLINGTGRLWVDNSRANQNNIGFGLNGEAQAFFQRTRAEQNTLSGYFGVAQIDVEMTNAFASQNGENGFAFDGEARAYLRNNSSEDNGLNGFALMGNASAELLYNLAANNDTSGFFVIDDARVNMTENLSEINGIHGILVAHRAQIELRANQLISNQSYGLFLTEDESISLQEKDTVYDGNVEGETNNLEE